MHYLLLYNGVDVSSYIIFNVIVFQRIVIHYSVSNKKAQLLTAALTITLTICYFYMRMNDFLYEAAC